MSTLTQAKRGTAVPARLLSVPLAVTFLAEFTSLTSFFLLLSVMPIPGRSLHRSIQAPAPLCARHLLDAAPLLNGPYEGTTNLNGMHISKEH